MGNPAALIAGAANTPVAGNPEFTKADFFEVYPQFEGLVQDFILDQFIAIAQVTVLQARWFETWTMGMCWFIAHFVTLYLETLGGCNPTATSIVANARARGLQTNKTAGDVSVGYDFNSIKLDGWQMYQTTIYGQQFANMAKLLGKGGMFVW